MILNTVQLRQKAHELALTHDPLLKKKPAYSFFRNLEQDVQLLHEFVHSLRTERTSCSQPAEEWLLDNAEFIDEQMIVIKQNLSRSLIRRLPQLKTDDCPRILSICRDYLRHVDGSYDEDSFLAYISSYQEVSVLRISETWAIPLMMQVALIQFIAEVLQQVRERTEMCLSVEKLLAPLSREELNPETIKAALEKAGYAMPLSGSLIVHLVKHLREWASDAAEVRYWLMCNLENGPESFDRIVSYEHQLQAAYQMTIGHIIGSLRNLSRLDWQEQFERICLVEQTLRAEQTGDYQKLDYASREVLRKRVERLARRLNVPENLVAKQAVELADQAYRQADHSDGLSPRESFIAYYLQEGEGMRRLHGALKTCAEPHRMPELSMLVRPSAVYFGILIAMFSLFFLLSMQWISLDLSFTASGWGWLGLLALIPAAEWGVGMTHWLIESLRNPEPLLRYDFSQGIPEEATTMVVVPVIWSSIEEVQQLANRLELHYLANRDHHLHFALLGDYMDADSEHTPMDKQVVSEAVRCIEKLNRTYRNNGGSRFHLFQRSRLWNPQEGQWMGWERKRGKLVEFVEFLKAQTNTSFSHIIGDEKVYAKIRYVITMDADTLLPLESAHRMVGSLHLPYNRPRFNEQKTRVAEGYGVLQPRIGISHQASLASRLAYLWSADPGVDPYAFAISDPYQDALGEGIFTGKGIFDVDAFHQVLCQRIPENCVLSHDLLEGGFLRAGQLSDIELIDDHPSTFRAFQMRLHRWVRGDWQLIPWLFTRMRDRKGDKVPVDLSSITRWQMVDNLRRSLTLPVLFITLWLGVTILPGSPWRWIGLVVFTMLFPLVRQIVTVRNSMIRPRSILATIGQIGLQWITLPFQSVMFIDAISRTLYRLFVSKKHLLEWVSSAEIERQSRGGRQQFMYGTSAGYALVVLFAVSAVIFTESWLQLTLIILSILWGVAPFIIQWLNQSVQPQKTAISESEKQELRQLAKQIWAFFAQYVTESDNWLPPDNVQMDPPKGVAHRTSPTNIGLYLSSVLAAKDFGFIDMPELLERLEKSLNTIDRLEKWNGHLYNWYDTTTLAPLPPKYVSTVDSGNYVCCLIAVKQGIAKWIDQEDEDDYTQDPLPPFQNERTLDVAFAEEISPVNHEPVEKIPERTIDRIDQSDWLIRAKQLINRLEQMIQEVNFRPLFSDKHKLFYLGYHADRQELEQIMYDLAASEARQASFIAIALGQVSVAHWHALGRTMTKFGKHATLLSWSGTMFEYLMPWLFMRTYANTIWESTYQSVVARQIQYAHERAVPFGISESGYYAFDHQLNYQYRAFGVPGLGFKRGLEKDLVISPYAAILALPYAGSKSLESLRQIEQLGGRGQYGFYEAIDFTKERIPAEHSHKIVRSFMAHHQGMSFLLIANLLLNENMIERFHRDKRVQAAEMLLQERIPAKPKIIRHPAMIQRHEEMKRMVDPSSSVREVMIDTRIPEVCLLSNGTLTAVISNSGSGLSRYNGIAVTRWREDPVLDEWGSYIYLHDVSKGRVWSPTFLPCRVKTKQMKASFSDDRAVFFNAYEEVEAQMEICVSPEWNCEVRRLNITNRSNETKLIEVTTFSELALANPQADAAHPAFNKLFIQTEYDENETCLLARRRSREEEEAALWAAHSLTVSGQSLGPPEFETDRASFIGRGKTLAEPDGIRNRLRGKTGSVADPAFIMRRRVSIEPGQQLQLFAVTAIGDTKDEVISMIKQLSESQVVEHQFQLAWNRSQIELRHLQLSREEAALFQALASQVIYTSPLRKERSKHIALNKKGQSALWAYGISGDRPVVCVTIEYSSHLKFIRQLLVAHEYLRRLGIGFDLVILNQSKEGYQQELQQSLYHLIEHGVDRLGTEPKGIILLQADQLPSEDLSLLLAVARIDLQAGGASLKAQLRWLGRGKDFPRKLEPAAKGKTYETIAEASSEQTLFFNGWGGFSKDGKEYQLVLKNGNPLPSPWSNVIANPGFGTLITEMGTGYTWWQNSREFKITPWSNDPVLDPPGEACYMRDEDTGEVWSPTPLAGNLEQAYHIAHGQGYTRFNHARFGIDQEMTVYVSRHDSVKLIELKLTNQTSERRRLSVTYYVEWVLGVERQSTASFIATDWDESAKVLLAENKYQETFRDAIAFLGVYPQAQRLADEETQRTDAEWSWTADRREFLGRNGTRQFPLALKREKLSGSVGLHSDTCGAVQLKLELGPKADTTVYIVLGCETSRETALQLAAHYSQAIACQQALGEAKSFWEDMLAHVEVETPSKEFDILINGWLLYQSLSCRIWARSAFYQAGGAYGFRDQLQDSLSMLHIFPDLTKAQILRNAAHQYREGDVQHWWHEETERGIRTHFSDDLLWLAYAVNRYIEHTGDLSILDESVPFLESPILQEGELERYEPTVVSDEQGTIYEHCVRAIERALSWTGEHGLPLIGIGDWNDGMSRVGAQFRGESVWLGWFICEILNQFVELAHQRGDRERAVRYQEVQKQLSEALDEHAWDGQWYRRAFTDAGTWLGSIVNEECRIDAIAQSWSVISKAAPSEKAMQAMHSFDRELVDRNLSVAQLLTPPFDRTVPSPGYIQGYPPGIRENGAQYTHGVIWAIIAWSQLGEGEKAFELFNMLNPINHTRTPNEVRQYMGEPYVMAADVYTAEPNKGRAGWTWYTGAAGWMFQAGFEWILGIRRRGDRLYIQPCIPSDWPAFSVRYRFGLTSYLIEVENPNRKQTGCSSLQVNGKFIDVKEMQEAAWIELNDDGREHHVKLMM